jgi:macrodomain Ter protein organizer (MatP/YcbG family)
MDFTEAELEAYIEESLDPVRAAQLEQAMREDETLVQKLSFINSRRDAGIHTLGEIWRRNQIGVPSGKRIRDFIMGIATDDEAEYIRFRLEVLKCPFTIACWKDLKEKLDDKSEQVIESRRRKYFNSSAGLLRNKEE